MATGQIVTKVSQGANHKGGFVLTARLVLDHLSKTLGRPRRCEIVASGELPRIGS
jgi:hypothetical protein